jgi:hypothetical protein
VSASTPIATPIHTARFTRSAPVSTVDSAFFSAAVDERETSLRIVRPRGSSTLASGHCCSFWATMNQTNSDRKQSSTAPR